MLFATEDILTNFLSNRGVPKEYMLIGLLTLNDRVFYLFLTLKNKFHEIHLDNL